MFDAATIAKLQESEAITAANEAIRAAGFTTLPSDFKIHDMERHFDGRRRARGSFSTPVLASFAEYTKAHAAPGTTVFIDPKDYDATAVLNLGTLEHPGHADNLANFEPTRTPAYSAMLTITGAVATQMAVAEFLEDWSDNIQCFEGGDSAAQISVPKAVTALRKITIEQLRKVDTEVLALSQTQSTFESVQASSTESIPTLVYFKCQPFDELSERTFVLRLSVSGTDRPVITLRVIKARQHAEEMGREFINVVGMALAKLDAVASIVVGTYKVGA